MERSLVVATYNLHHGAPLGTDVARPAAQRRVVAAFDADIVALQEVDVHSARSWFHDQAGRMARRAGLTARYVATRRMVGGRYGIAMLTKRPLQPYLSMALPVGPRREPRAALFGTYHSDFGPISVAAVHLQAVRPAERAHPEALAQLRVVLEALERWPLPRLIMGDFNLRPDAVEPVLAEFGYQHADSGNTFPSDLPMIKIDWIAAKGARLVDGEVIETQASDHRPHRARLVMDAPTGLSAGVGGATDA